MSLPVIMTKVADLALALGAENLSHQEGLWSHEIKMEGEPSLWLDLNGHAEEQRGPRGGVPPWSCLITRQGFPVAIVDPRGGILTGNNEDDLIAILETEIQRAKGAASGFGGEDE